MSGIGYISFVVEVSPGVSIAILTSQDNPIRQVLLEEAEYGEDLLEVILEILTVHSLANSGRNPSSYEGNAQRLGLNVMQLRDLPAPGVVTTAKDPLGVD